MSKRIYDLTVGDKLGKPVPPDDHNWKLHTTELQGDLRYCIWERFEEEQLKAAPKREDTLVRVESLYSFVKASHESYWTRYEAETAEKAVRLHIRHLNPSTETTFLCRTGKWYDTLQSIRYYPASDCIGGPSLKQDTLAVLYFVRVGCGEWQEMYSITPEDAAVRYIQEKNIGTTDTGYISVVVYHPTGSHYYRFIGSSIC